MPAEWEPHDRTWMAWPAGGYALGDTEREAQATRNAWASVANAIVPFEPVTMVVPADDVAIATSFLDERVNIVTAKLDDAWMRDTGPTFVRTAGKTVSAVNWVFNGWGAQDWASWKNDNLVAPTVAATTGVSVIASPLVNEGGGIHVNGAGTILLTETVQLDPGRNPDWSKKDVENELRRTVGVQRFIWFPRGLTRDYDEFGTRGHVDIVACFSDENTVLFHAQRNAEHPDFWISNEVRRILREWAKKWQKRDANGEPLGPPLRVIGIPAPEILRDDDGWVDYSYINHYVCNGAVIMCTFDDPSDAVARRILKRAYPGRKIVGVDARAIFARGGGIHCITQQQPSAV
jgi:agmatine deiminase